jgi:hypothetical protein
MNYLPTPAVTTVKFPDGLAAQFFNYEWDQQTDEPLDVPSRISLIVGNARSYIMTEAQTATPPAASYKWRTIANVDIGLSVVQGSYQESGHPWITYTITVDPAATIIWSNTEPKFNPVNLGKFEKPPIS